MFQEHLVRPVCHLFRQLWWVRIRWRCALGGGNPYPNAEIQRCESLQRLLDRSSCALCDCLTFVVLELCCCLDSDVAMNSSFRQSRRLSTDSNGGGSASRSGSQRRQSSQTRIPMAASRVSPCDVAVNYSCFAQRAMPNHCFVI